MVWRVLVHCAKLASVHCTVPMEALADSLEFAVPRAVKTESQPDSQEIGGRQITRKY